MNIPIPGITVTLSSAALFVCSEQPLSILSSAVAGGGWIQSRYILNYHVHKDYANPDPLLDLEAYACGQGICEPYVGLMTAAYVHKARSATLVEGSITVSALTTAGLSNATAAGFSPPARFQPGTINIILILDANLSPAAAVNAVITATEAKTGFLHSIGARTPQGDPATGTSTDSIVIACTGRGESLPYAGPATLAGWLIARTVRATLEELWHENPDKQASLHPGPLSG